MVRVTMVPVPSPLTLMTVVARKQPEPASTQRNGSARRSGRMPPRMPQVLHVRDLRVATTASVIVFLTDEAGSRHSRTRRALGGPTSDKAGSVRSDDGDAARAQSHRTEPPAPAPRRDS